MRAHLLRAVPRSIDIDAASYISAVEAADGQALEAGVKTAINDFFIGCKSDGTWSAIKACCILAGARTLSGALIPLVGAAPTNYNFVAGDYNRKTGLKGNGTSKYLNSNRSNNADSQDSKHLSVYRSEAASNNGGLLGANGYGSGYSHVYTGYGLYIARINGSTFNETSLSVATGPVFFGASRSNGNNFTVRIGGTSYTQAATSQAPPDVAIYVLRAVEFSDARISFYSIGGSLDLAALGARVTTLMNALASAIP